jgi:hypothetical protein
MGGKQYAKFRKGVAEGRTTPYLDGRRSNQGRPKSSWYDVDAFFTYLYENVAEPLAETDISEAFAAQDAG